LFTTALFLVALLAGNSESIDPAAVPAGRPYAVSTLSSGEEIATIECPALATWMISTDRDPLCASSRRTGITFAAGALAVDGALLAGIVALQRSRHRTTRPSR
jgi:hypothetical protein